MDRRLIVAVFAAALLPLAVGAQAQNPADKPAAPAEIIPPPPEANVPKRFVPGLVWFMNLIQTEHAKLWYAGEAGNWKLAQYHLAEIKEVMSEVQDFVPVYKSLPFADMMDAVIVGPIGNLEKAIDAKDAAAFAERYDGLTAACNACHKATDHDFIRIRRPAAAGFPNQDFEPQ